MENRITISRDAALLLFENEKEKFLNSFGEGYGLEDDERLWLAFTFLPEKAERKAFFIGMSPLREDSIKSVIDVFDEFFPSMNVAEWFIQKGELHFLKFSQRLFKETQALLEEDKYVSEVYDYCYQKYLKNGDIMSFSLINEEKIFSLLEKHGEWGILAQFNQKKSAEILFSHERFQEMLESGNEEHYSMLWERGKSTLVRDYISKVEYPKDKCNFNLVTFFHDRKDWEMLSKTSIVQHCPQEWLWYLLCYREQKNLPTEELWEFVSGTKFFTSGAYYRGFREYIYSRNWNEEKSLVLGDDLGSPYEYCTQEAFIIWVYKNLKPQWGNPKWLEDERKLLRKLYPWYSSIRKKMKDPNFPTKLAEIEKALND